MYAACFTTPSTKETIKMLTVDVLFVRKLYMLHFDPGSYIYFRKKNLLSNDDKASEKREKN